MNTKTTSHGAPPWLGRTLMAVGLSGAAFAALCCVAPFMVAGLVTALGLGFLLNDALLLGLLVVFTGVAALGSYMVRRRTCA
ncbi:MAG TPA: hypothetical protein PKD12_09015 [Nitrospira sp.]|nr:hypothetical protein [Nitrospira sp.]